MPQRFLTTAVFAAFLLTAPVMSPIASAHDDSTVADISHVQITNRHGQLANTYGMREVDTEGVVHRIGIDAGITPLALVFMNTLCPVSNRFAPKLNEIAAQPEEAGVAFYGVMSAPYLTATEAQDFVAD